MAGPGSPATGRARRLLRSVRRNPAPRPWVSGTARVGETLTASSTGIADADGLTDAAFAWQWIANDGTDDEDIADATDATWTLTAAEQGKTVKVRATFTDDGGTEETLTSAATEAVAAGVQQQVASDTEAPTVTVTSDATGPVTGDFEVTVTFSEPVTGFEMSELAIVNGAASPTTAAGRRRSRARRRRRSRRCRPIRCGRRP